MGKSADRWGVLLLMAAVLSALLLCLPALRGQALALDEHVSYYCSGAPSLGELWKRCSESAVLPPLSHLLERAAIEIGGRSESVFRLPSLMAYVLSVPAVWWLGRILGGPVAGGVAAMVVAWHPGMLDEVRFGRCYGLVLLLSALSTGGALRWRQLQTPGSRWWLAGWALSAGALCWTHYLTAPLVAAQAAVMMSGLVRLGRSRRRDVEVAVTSAVIGVAASCAPFAPALLRLREWSRHIEYQRVPATVSEAFGADWTVPALIVVAMSMAWIRVRGCPSAEGNETVQGPRLSMGWPVVLWLVPLVIVAAMALLGRPMLASPRYRVMIVAPSAIAMGLALSRAFVRSLAVVAGIGVVALSTFLHGSSPTVAGRLANPIEEEWKRAGLELREPFEDPAVLVFTQTGLAEGVLLPSLSGSERFRKYVACRLGGFYTGSERALPIPLLWNGAGRLRDEYRTVLKAPGVREVRVVGADDTDLNADSITVFAGFLESSGYQLAASETRPGITLLRFERTRGGGRPAGQEK